MSELPPAGHPSAPGPAGYPPAMAPAGPWGPVGPPAPGRPARWPLVVTSLISLISVGVAIAAWLRPIPHETLAAPAAPTYTEQQIADAKAKVCAVIAKVKKAGAMNSTRNGGDDPNGQLLIAVNGRQVYIASSEYILTTLADEPATPSELAAAGRKLAGLYQVIAIDGLASDTSPETRSAAEATGQVIDGLCK